MTPFRLIWFGGLKGQAQPVVQAWDAAPERLYAVGDLHGHAHLFQCLERLLASEAEAEGVEITLVLLGDMIDRGPQSAQLLEHLCQPPPKRVRRVPVMGNHEAMALAAMQTSRATKLWLSHGGLETLASYGCEVHDEITPRRLRTLMPAHHIRFVETLPTVVSMPGVLLCHAGIDRSLPASVQSVNRLLWGAGEDFDVPESGGPLVVQGHLRVETPQRRGQTVFLDTGAFATGRLGLVRIDRGQEPELRVFSEQRFQAIQPLEGAE